MLTFGRMIRTTQPIPWQRRETSPGKFAEGFIIPAGTIGLIVTNLDRLPLTLEERSAISQTARHNAATGRPGVIAWLRDKPRFIEFTDFDYETPPTIQHHMEYEL